MKKPVGKFWQDILGVYFTTTFLVYSWSMLVFFWEIPSFLLRLSLGDIAAYAAYQLSFALLESLVVTAVVAILAAVLPAKILRETLKISGSALVLAIAVNAWIFKGRITIISWALDALPLNTNSTTLLLLGVWVALLFLLPAGFVLAASRERLAGRIADFVDRLSVLAILYTALSLCGIVVILLRNIS